MAQDDLKKIKKILKEESPELVAQLMANLIEHNRKLEARIEAIEKQQFEKEQSALLLRYSRLSNRAKRTTSIREHTFRWRCT